MIQTTAFSQQQWLRIEHPSQQVREALKSKGIHYKNFIWINENQLDKKLIREHKYKTTINNPYAYRMDQQWLDLKSYNNENNNPWMINLSSDKKAFHLVQFAGPIKPEWLQDLKNRHIVPVSPLAPFSWIVWSDTEQLNQLKQQTFIRATHYFYSAFKVQESNRSLAPMSYPTAALVYNETIEQTRQKLKTLGAIMGPTHIINKHLSALNFDIPGDQYLKAAEINGIMTVQQVHNDGGPRGEMSQQSIVGNYNASNVIQTGYITWLNNTGLDGSGVTVSVVDGGVHENHPDLTNVISCTGTGLSCINTSDSHGTHVAGAIGGTGQNNALDGAGFNRGLGIAPGATIVEQAYGPLLGAGPGGMVAGGMLSIYKDSATSGAMLTNNSWGPTGSPQGYDIPTMEIDMISRDANPDQAGNQPVLAVWSIMNGNGDSGGACAPSALGSPDEAKNLFAVGSTKLQTGSGSQITDFFDISANSAHGPACDGRLVPHIVAPGCSTDAPDSASGYGTMCGTSMASPVVSGSIALFWEQYNNAFSTAPSPALIKAVFTVIADDLEGNRDADNVIMGHAPNRQQGWGRINLDAVINTPHEIYYYDQATTFVNSGENWTQTLVADDPAESMRLMLVWTDAPGAGLGGTSSAWVNDLDLRVTADNLYLGNQFGSDSYSASGGTADSINNMEGVFLRANQHNGNPISIEVLAANIAGDALNPHSPGAPSQDFALVCYNCKSQTAGIDLIYKSGFDAFTDLIFQNGFE